MLEAFRNRRSPRPLVTLASSRVLQVKITYLRKREIIFIYSIVSRSKRNRPFDNISFRLAKVTSSNIFCSYM